jgi:hypothetical protein
MLGNYVNLMRTKKEIHNSGDQVRIGKLGFIHNAELAQLGVRRAASLSCPRRTPSARFAAGT